MVTVVMDQVLEQRLQAERAAAGADRYDEVWEGTYMMAPTPNDEHQQLVTGFVSILQDTIGWPQLGDVFPGANVSDRADDWQQNYRVPDVAVFLKSGDAENREAFWLGGPDFAIEITSPDDQTCQKLGFYAAVYVQELLIVHRDPWQLELRRLADGQLASVGVVSVQSANWLCSQVLPHEFCLESGAARPEVCVRHTETGREWRV